MHLDYRLTSNVVLSACVSSLFSQAYFVLIVSLLSPYFQMHLVRIVQPRARSARARRACALRALGLLLYSRIPQWEGRRLFDRSAGFFYGNSCNSRTESRKIVPKLGN